MNIDARKVNLDKLPKELGIPLQPDEQKALKTFLYQQLKYKEGSTYVLGAQPVSMDKDNIKLVNQDNYVVCEKSDGVRYFLLILQNTLYYITRNTEIYKSTIPIPNDALPDNLRTFATLIDGEMIIEKERLNEGEKPYLCYWAFDLMLLGGYSVLERDLYQRLQLLTSAVLYPIQKKYPQNDLFPFHIELKPMYNIRSSEFIWKNIVNKTLHHNCDGLIFTPIYESYKPGECQTLLKWKPFTMNSVDFKVIVEEKQSRSVYALYTLRDGFQKRYDYGSFNEDEVAQYAMDGQIVEFVYDPERYTFMPDPLSYHTTVWIPSSEYNDSERGRGWRKGGWKPLRVREDKTTPNSIRVANNVLKSISDNLTFEKMFDMIMGKNVV